MCVSVCVCFIFPSRPVDVCTERLFFFSFSCICLIHLDSTFLCSKSTRYGHVAGGKKYMDPFLSMHVFISQFAVHHDARPSVSARWLNSMPICCRVMRKQTGAAFHVSGPSITQPTLPQCKRALMESEHATFTCVLLSRMPGRDSRYLR